MSKQKLLTTWTTGPQQLGVINPFGMVKGELHRLNNVSQSTLLWQFCKFMVSRSNAPVRDLLLVLLAVFLFQVTGSAQSSPPKTVLDYYLLLPDEYFEANKEQRVKWMLAPGRGAVIDIKNGYIYAPGDGAQTSIYVCLFRRSRGFPLVAVKSYPPDTDEFTYLHLYEYKHRSLVEVKKGVLPVEVNEKLKYDMPRYGKTIEVRNHRGKRIYSLNWSGRRFVLKR